MGSLQLGREYFTSSYQRCSIKEAVLIMFAIFTEKRLQACNFIKKRLQHRYFPVSIANFLRTSILNNIYDRLLLNLLNWIWLTITNYQPVAANGKPLIARCQTKHLLPYKTLPKLVAFLDSL